MCSVLQLPCLMHSALSENDIFSNKKPARYFHFLTLQTLVLALYIKSALLFVFLCSHASHDLLLQCSGGQVWQSHQREQGRVTAAAAQAVPGRRPGRVTNPMPTGFSSAVYYFISLCCLPCSEFMPMEGIQSGRSCSVKGLSEQH
jgi:hypothetical protein